MKIFCIGFNKTGTSSIHSLFADLGWKSYHGIYSDWGPDDPRFGEYEIFSDGEDHDFKSLDGSFHGSRFILTSRRLDDWLVSRVRHIEIRKAVNKSGWMRREYEAGPRRAMERWINYRSRYHSAVYAHFADQPDRLLSLNLCDSADQSVDLHKLLRFADLPVDATDHFPHKRNTNQVVSTLGSDLKRLLLGRYRPKSEQKIRLLVESVLTEMGIDQSEWESDGLSDSDSLAAGTETPVSASQPASIASTQK